MEWLAENWLWVLVGILFVVMHLFGHGGHGGHVESGRHDNHKDENKDRNSVHGHH